jgi:hypothetical protein
MTATHEQPAPIKVQIVEDRKAPAVIAGIPTTYSPSANGVQQILGTSTRRRRAVISVTGNGTVAFGQSNADVSNSSASNSGVALVTAPAVFELQSTTPWWVGNITGTALVSVIAEIEQDT